MLCRAMPRLIALPRCPEDVDAVTFTTGATGVDGIQALHATAAALREQVTESTNKPTHDL
jgi:hypothetical protein